MTGSFSSGQLIFAFFHSGAFGARRTRRRWRAFRSGPTANYLTSSRWPMKSRSSRWRTNGCATSPTQVASENSF
eukprot:36824-Pleurochrysis_carterae.AAC.1